MPTHDNSPDIDVIHSLIQNTFGARVDSIGLPGGKKRPIYRVRFNDTSVIVSRRDDPEILHKERDAIARLASAGYEDIPRILAVRDAFTIQTDLGQRRLNFALHQCVHDEAVEILHAACLSLLDMQTRAAGLDWGDAYAPVRATRQNVRHFARGCDRMAKLYKLPTVDFDVDVLAAAVASDGPRFVKWDARAANGAMNADGNLGWFDFELCGTREGFEDFAWLLCDESLPLEIAPYYERFIPIIQDAALADDAATRADFLRRFEIFATLQTSLRLRVIANEIHQKSWTSRAEILKYDLVGANPYMGRRLASTGAFLAARNPETRNFVPLFEGVQQVFTDALSATRQPAQTS